MKRFIARTACLLALCAIVLGLSACGPIDVAGTWEGPTEGTVSGIGAKGSITFTITQDGEKLSGTWRNNVNSSGSITGKIVERAVEFTADASGNCKATFIVKGNLNNENNEISGTMKGSFCLGTVNLTFTAKKKL